MQRGTGWLFESSPRRVRDFFAFLARVASSSGEASPIPRARVSIPISPSRSLVSPDLIYGEVRRGAGLVEIFKYVSFQRDEIRGANRVK